MAEGIYPCRAMSHFIRPGLGACIPRPEHRSETSLSIYPTWYKVTGVVPRIILTLLGQPCCEILCVVFPRHRPLPSLGFQGGHCFFVQWVSPSLDHC